MDKKWNLQDIKPVERKKRSVPPEMRPKQAAAPKKTVTSTDDGTVRLPIEDGKKQKRSSFLLIVMAFLCIFGGIFAFSYLTSGAEVSVYPRFREPNVNADFTAYKTPQAGELSYEILTLEADGERQVTASGKESVTELATGRITVYKTTPGAQRLIKNTRFEAPNGNIYRATETVVVPGSIDGNPGSIQATVFADQPGEAYNLDTARFTVPGLEDDQSLFTAIYAEINEPITGGFAGDKFIIDDTELASAKQALHVELRNALLERVPNEKPAGFVVFDDAVTFTYESQPSIAYGDDTATIKEKALLQIPLFKREDFASYIAAATVPGYENQPVRIDDYAILNFSYTSATTSSSNISAADAVTFTLTGRPTIVWMYDEEKLKTDLLGSAQTALPSVLGAYPAIEKAEAIIRPFWKRTFPATIEDITVTEIVTAASQE